MLDFAANLRLDKEEGEKKKALATLNPELFSFYHKDMEKWISRTTVNNSPTRPNRKYVNPHDKSPYNVIDVDIKGNSGTVSISIRDDFCSSKMLLQEEGINTR